MSILHFILICISQDIQETPSTSVDKQSLVDIARLSGTRKSSRKSKKRKNENKTSKSPEVNNKQTNIAQENIIVKNESNNENHYNMVVPTSIMYDNNIYTEKFQSEPGIPGSVYMQSINDWNNQNSSIIHDEQTNLFELDSNDLQPIYDEMMQNPNIQQKIADEINFHLSKLSQDGSNDHNSSNMLRSFHDNAISSIANTILNDGSLKSLSSPPSPEKSCTGFKRDREDSMSNTNFISVKKRKNYSPPKSRSRRSSPTKYGFDRSNDPLELFREDSSDPFMYI